MPQIPNLPADLVTAPGVEMIPPPVQLLPSMDAIVMDAVKNLPTDEDGLFTVWVSTTKGVNLAHVQRVGTHAEIVSYVGKSWGKPLDAGVAVKVHW